MPRAHLTVHGKGLVQRLGELPRDHGHILGVVDAREEKGELVSGFAGHRIALAHGRSQALSNSLQELVACGVAQSVVDLLEAIEVDEDHRQPVPIPMGLGQGDGQSIVEETHPGRPRPSRPHPRLAWAAALSPRAGTWSGREWTHPRRGDGQWA